MAEDGAAFLPAADCLCTLRRLCPPLFVLGAACFGVVPLAPRCFGGVAVCLAVTGDSSASSSTSSTLSAVSCTTASCPPPSAAIDLLARDWRRKASTEATETDCGLGAAPCLDRGACSGESSSSTTIDTVSLGADELRERLRVLRRLPLTLTRERSLGLRARSASQSPPPVPLALLAVSAVEVTRGSSALAAEGFPGEPLGGVDARRAALAVLSAAAAAVVRGGGPGGGGTSRCPGDTPRSAGDTSRCFDFRPEFVLCTAAAAAAEDAVAAARGVPASCPAVALPAWPPVLEEEGAAVAAVPLGAADPSAARPPGNGPAAVEAPPPGNDDRRPAAAEAMAAAAVAAAFWVAFFLGGCPAPPTEDAAATGEPSGSAAFDLLWRACRCTSWGGLSAACCTLVGPA